MSKQLRRFSSGTPLLILVGVMLGGIGGAMAAGGARPLEDLGFGAAVAVWIGSLLVHVGLLGLRALLQRGGGVGAVAGVLVAETVRRRVAWICAILMLIGLATIPFLVQANQVLAHRLSSFLGYSLFVTFFLLSILTMFGASGSLCEEIDDRRIHSVVVKPVGRIRFLIGKWLGLVMLDLLLLIVAGVVTLGSFHWQLAVARSQGVDVTAAEQLLVSRGALIPDRPEGLVEGLAERADRRRKSDPVAWQARVAELAGDEAHAFIDLQREVYKESMAQARTVSPGATRLFTFSVPGLGEGAVAPRLRLAPFFGRVHSSDRTRLLVRLDGEEHPVFLGGGESTELAVPTSALADGTLRVEIENPIDEGLPSHPASFAGRDDLSLEIPRGSLTSNLARGLAIIAIELAFIAALGIAAATFLGLPVAILLVSLILFAAAGGGFFFELEPPADVPAHLHGHDHGHGHDHSLGAPSGFMRALDGVGRSFVKIFSAWGRYSPIDEVSSGTVIPLSDLFGCLVWIGGVWTGIVSACGMGIFLRREIARVQV